MNNNTDINAKMIYFPMTSVIKQYH